MYDQHQVEVYKEIVSWYTNALSEQKWEILYAIGLFFVWGLIGALM